MSKERRSYFRIDDQASISCIPIAEPMQFNELEGFFAQLKNQPLFIEMQNLNDTTNAAIDQLGKKSPILASCVRALNLKLDLMVKMMNPNFAQTQGDHYTNINLSEGGIRITSSGEFNANQCLAIKLVLLPAYLKLHLCGRVTHCVKKDDQFEIGIEFIDYPASQRQSIVKHIMQLQAMQRLEA